MNNNVLEFYIRMKDLMSGSLGKLAQTSKQTFNKIQSDVKQVQKVNKDFMYSIDGVRAKLQDAKRVMETTNSRSVFKTAISDVRQFQRELDVLERKSGTGAGGSGGGLMGMVSRFAPFAAAAYVGNKAFQFGKASVQQYADFEKTSKTYQVLARNRGIGTVLAGELNDLKQNSILGTSVYPNAQMLMAFGDRSDKVIPHLKMLGDVSMGDPEKLHRLAYAFGEVEASGRLTGRQLMQMTTAGFNPLLEMSNKTGESMEVLRTKMRKGEISFRDVEKAFESATGKGGMFNNMMNEMADTTAGKMMMLKGKVAALEISIGELLAPAVNWALNDLTNTVHVLKDWVGIPIESKIKSQIDQVRQLQTELMSSNTSHDRQLTILRELENINPHIVEGINKQSIEYGKLKKNIDDVVGSLRSKMVADSFTKENQGILTQWQTAGNKVSEYAGKIRSIVHKVSPELAQDPTLSENQKMLKAREILLKRVQAEPDMQDGQHTSMYTNKLGITFRLNSHSKDNRDLADIQEYLRRHKRYVGVANALNPQVREIYRTKSALEAEYNRYAGVKSGVAADIINNPNNYKKGGNGEEDGFGGAGTSVASGINSGGPRVVNISGVKFADKIEINTTTPHEGEAELERRLEEMFLRILNSGANLQ